MELKITRGEFLKGLHMVQGISEAKGTMPILSYLLIETEEGGITISATDLEIGVKGSYKAEVIKEGKITLNARKIFDIVREFPEGDILLTEEKDNIPEDQIGSWITILCGNSKFRIASLPPEDFPSIPVYEEEGTIEFESSMLKEMIKKTFFSISSDETRPSLNGVLLQAEGQDVYMISTDGYRLTYIKKGLGKPIKGDRLNVIISRKTLIELLKLLEDSQVPMLFGIQKNHAAFRINGLFMISRLIEGEFPNYENLIPKDNNKKLIINRDNLIYALRRVSILADEKSRMVKFNIMKNQLVLISDSTEVGEAKEEIVAEYQEDEMSIGLNARYVLDAVSAMDTDEVCFNLKGPDSSCLITSAKDEDYKCIVMPMRVKNAL